ncbi:hypothetical protein EDD85DRAFT_783836 [Armillaria nabsnona]|nr:hypothetical protein EDD85DRAFT_783836 [Armillaria nabsnona]
MCMQLSSLYLLPAPLPMLLVFQCHLCYSHLRQHLPTSPLSSRGSLLSINGDSDVKMVISSNIVTDTEATSIIALVTPCDDSLWVAGKKFHEIPPQPIIISNVVSSNKWYAVFKGLWVGIVTSFNMASSATDGVSTAFKRGFKSQQAVVDAFNKALDDGIVAILTK